MLISKLAINHFHIPNPLYSVLLVIALPLFFIFLLAWHPCICVSMTNHVHIPSPIYPHLFVIASSLSFFALNNTCTCYVKKKTWVTIQYVSVNTYIQIHNSLYSHLFVNALPSSIRDCIVFFFFDYLCPHIFVYQ